MSTNLDRSVEVALNKNLFAISSTEFRTSPGRPFAYFTQIICVQYLIYFSPVHSRDLELQYDAIGLKIHHNKVLDAGPFYLRFASSIILQIEGKELEGFNGISEFLNPERLQSRFMRFFTRSRIWRDGEPSLMYDSYNHVKRSLNWINS